MVINNRLIKAQVAVQAGVNGENFEAYDPGINLDPNENIREYITNTLFECNIQHVYVYVIVSHPQIAETIDVTTDVVYVMVSWTTKMYTNSFSLNCDSNLEYFIGELKHK